MRGLTRSIAALRQEAAKCVLLCANCHAKVEWGAEELPAKLSVRAASRNRTVTLRPRSRSKGFLRDKSDYGPGWANW